MNYKTVKLPAEFLDEVKISATKEFRSVSQQLLYWATLGRNVAQARLKIKVQYLSTKMFS